MRDLRSAVIPWPNALPVQIRETYLGHSTHVHYIKTIPFLLSYQITAVSQVWWEIAALPSHDFIMMSPIRPVSCSSMAAVEATITTLTPRRNVRLPVVGWQVNTTQYLVSVNISALCKPLLCNRFIDPNVTRFIIVRDILWDIDLLL